MDLIIELKIKNPKDWDIIQPILQRLKISFTKKEVLPTTVQDSEIDADLQELQAMLLEGVDASYYGNPVEFQKNARIDIEQPLRN